MKWPAVLLAVVGLMVATPGRGRTAMEEWAALSLTTPLRHLLNTGQWDATPRGFRVMALSFLADACVAEARTDRTKERAAQACVARCLQLAERTGHQPPRPESDDGLWLTHYALILGAADALGSCPQAQRHQAIASALASRSLRDPHLHAASYNKARSRWPADQTATLASLGRTDRAHGTHLLEKPAAAWRAYMLSKAMDQDLGLPWSEVTGSARTAREPRGCALSLQTRYLHEFDDALARQWWTAYRRRFLVEHLGLAGFREWPPGRDRKADVDSGPIVDGVGAAASGLGIAAARAMGDESLANQIERTARVVGLVASHMRGAQGALPEAIRYLGAQLRP
jgi:hypothetical protein